MPTTIILDLTATAPLFFDESRPLVALLRETVAGSGVARSLDRQRGPKPVCLSPIWRKQPAKETPRLALSEPGGYWWRICVLDDGLAPELAAALEAADIVALPEAALAIEQITVEHCSYRTLSRWAQRQARRPRAARYLELEFITPVVLRRDRIPYPLPDPRLIFHHYLTRWDTFAPRELGVNLNVLDAIEAHVGLIEHRLESRQVRLADRRRRTGFIGRAKYKMMAWEKLGAEMLGTFQGLARFGAFCGTGGFTGRGLGQTRYVGRAYEG